MAKKYCYVIYSCETNELVGVYDSVAEIVERYYGLSRNNPNFKRKVHSLETVIYYKKKVIRPRKWIIYKEIIEED
ncbi:hypothetical protein [Spiroplasma endosymbiont of Clivina fossor]|uniref:hypothetical protein n=1 Tax=Spiroplasma endosymbiont of Clivina fossor TaxID=3066282 RepID=UPI00313EC826